MSFLTGFAVGVAVTYFRASIWAAIENTWYKIGGK